MAEITNPGVINVANQNLGGVATEVIENDVVGLASSVPPTTTVQGGALSPIVGAATNVTVGLGVQSQVRAGSGLVPEVYV